MTKPGNRIKRWGFGPAFFFGLVSASSVVCADYELFGGASTALVSEPEPIKTTLDDWGAEFEDGKRQWALARLEAGLRLDFGLEVSVFSRAMADIRMNEEAVAFYGQIARKEDLAAGQQVPVSVRVNGFTGHGVRLGYLHRDDEWKVGVGLSVFRAGHLLSGDLTGQFTATGNSDYNFDAEVDYAYYQDAVFDRPGVEKSSGLGWGVDFTLAQQINNNWSWALKAEDLFARVRWEDAPYTVARASTDQKNYDQDGYAVFAPLLSGTEGYKQALFQELKARYYASVDFRQSGWVATMRGQYQFGYGYLGVGGGRRFDSGVEVLGLYWPKYDQFGMEARYGKWAGSLTIDQACWEKVQSLVFALSYGY